MACPQVAGIAALAVSEFGGSGFTNTDLVEMLMESGRRELTESHNPEYVGQLGNGLIDAGYIFFRDAVPAPVTQVTATGRRCRVEMEWKAPSDYKGGPLTGYDIYVSATPFSASTVEDIPDEAECRHVDAVVAEDGQTVSCYIDGLDPDTEYCFAVVSLSPGGTPAAPHVFTARTSDTAPVAVKPLPDIYVSDSDRIGVSFSLGEYFSDADMPDDELTYFVSFPSTGTVIGRTEGEFLRLLPQNSGAVTLTVIAADADGKTAGQPMRVIVNSVGPDIDLYPNPCGDVLNIRIPGAEGVFPVRIYDVAGGLVLSADVTVSDTEESLSSSPAGTIDVSSLAPGRYTCETDYFGKTVSSMIIKR